MKRGVGLLYATRSRPAVMAMAGMCSSCHSLEMGRGDDGFWYCRVCGAQSQNFLEEAFDHDDVHLFNLRHVREKNVARGEDMMMAGILASQQQQQDQQQQELGLFSSQNLSQQNLAFLGDFSSQFGVLSQFGSQPGIAKIEQTGPVLPESLVAHTLNSQVGLSQADKLSSKIRSVYVEGMQILLQLQCEALVQKFGVNPLVCGIAGPVWMRFVASTCVFEKGWANEVLLVAEARALKPRKSRQSGIGERMSSEPFFFLQISAYTYIGSKCLQNQILMDIVQGLGFQSPGVTCFIRRTNLTVIANQNWEHSQSPLLFHEP